MGNPDKASSETLPEWIALNPTEVSLVGIAGSKLSTICCANSGDVATKRKERNTSLFAGALINSPFSGRLIGL
jgi:hypothetical protein